MIPTPVVIVTASPRLLSTGATTTVRMAGGGDRAKYYFGGNFYRAGVAQLPKFKAKLDWDQQGWTGGVTPTVGVLSWFPSVAADYDSFANDYLWTDAAITIELGYEGSDGSAPSSWTTILNGTIADLQAQDGGLSFTVADLSDKLSKPFIAATFAGTGGIEGPVEATGRAKRRALGNVFNVEGSILDPANNIWEFGDPAFSHSSFDVVRDKGRPAPAGSLTTVAWAGSIAATLTALQAATAPQGGGVLCPSIACVKWWTTPAGPLTADITGGTYATAPELASYVIGLAGVSWDATSRAAAATARAGAAGALIEDTGTTAAQVVDTLLQGVSMTWILDPTGVVFFRPIQLSGSVETLTSLLQTRQTVFAPMKTRRLGYQKNQRIHSDSEIAASIISQGLNALGGDNMISNGAVAVDSADWSLTNSLWQSDNNAGAPSTGRFRFDSGAINRAASANAGAITPTGGAQKLWISGWSYHEPSYTGALTVVLDWYKADGSASATASFQTSVAGPTGSWYAFQTGAITVPSDASGFKSSLLRGPGTMLAYATNIRVAKTAPAADVTGANTALNIAGQGALATQSTADFATQVSGNQKPDDNATSSDNEVPNSALSSSAVPWILTGGAYRIALSAGGPSAYAICFPPGSPSATAATVNQSAKTPLGDSRRRFVSGYAYREGAITGSPTLYAVIYWYKSDGTVASVGQVNLNVLPATAGSWVPFSLIADAPTDAAFYTAQFYVVNAVGSLYAVGLRVSKTAPAADVTAANTAANIAGQGALATVNQADFASQIIGLGKPENFASSSDNMIPNGNLLTGSEGWYLGNALTTWTSAGGPSSGCIKLVGDPSVIPIAIARSNTQIAMSAADKLFVSGYCLREPSLVGDIQLVIDYYAAGSYLTSAAFSINTGYAASLWLPFALPPITPPANTVSGVIYFRRVAGSTGNMYFTAIRVGKTALSADVTAAQPIVGNLDPTTGRVINPLFYNTQAVAGLLSTTTISPTYTVGGSNVTVNIPSHTRKVAGVSAPVSLSYGAGSGVVAFSSYWIAYVDDPNRAGIASPTYSFTNNPDDLLVAGRYFVASGVTPASGGTGGSSGGGGGGGYGGGGTCVAADSWLPDGRKARDYRPGDTIRVLDYATLDSAAYTDVERNILQENDCVRLTSASGVTLVCSVDTPITVRDGSMLNVREALGRELPVEDRDGFRWEEIVALEPVGRRMVARISCHGATYAAGCERGRFIYTHNPAKP